MGGKLGDPPIATLPSTIVEPVPFNNKRISGQFQDAKMHLKKNPN